VGLKLLSLLKNAKVIALDTAPFIYFIEENPTYINIVEPLFQEISRGNLRAFTSYITLIDSGLRANIQQMMSENGGKINGCIRKG
jgi:hypothetical protein